MSPLKLNGSTSGFVALDAPAAAGSNTLTLPTGNGSNGQALTTNGSGVLSFSTITSSQWTTSGSDINYTAGKVLVGTSSSSADATLVLMKHSGDANGPGILHLSNPNSAPGSGAGLGLIRFSNSTQNTFASIEAYADAASGSNDYPGRLVFSTTADGASSPTERMRLSASGEFRQFSSSGAGTAQFASGNGASGNPFLTLSHSASGIGGGTDSFRVHFNGDVRNTNNSYGAISDIKLKENIVDATSQWNDLKALQVRKYNFKEETRQETHTQIGLIAQEVELVSPGLVSESPDRDEEGNDLGTVTKSVNYSVLYMKAVKALQEAIGRIETLEANNAALEARLTALEVTP